MLAELMKKLEQMAKATAATERIEMPGGKATQFVYADGSRETVEHDPPVRTTEVFAFSDFVNLVLDEELATKPEVHYTSERLVAALDRTTRDDKVFLRLQKSNRFDALESLDGMGKAFPQRELIDFFRVSLPCDAGDHLLPLIRQLDFQRKSGGRSRVDHQSESMGNEIEEEAQGTSEIPETLTLVAPVFANPGLVDIQISAKVVLTIEFQNQCIRLRAQADAISDGIWSAAEEVGRRLREKLPEIPVFHASTF